MTRLRIWLVAGIAGAITIAGGVLAQAADSDSGRAERAAGGLTQGFEPAVVKAASGTGRYFVLMDAPAATAATRSSQDGAIAAAKSAGGKVVFRYDTLVNGFSASLTPDDAAALAGRPDVSTVEPVPVVTKTNESSVPFVGATNVWDDLGVKGQGMRVAVVDDGIDYTHANFGGPGTVEAFESNNPNFIEPGTFPTKKVIGGYDFVGSNYDLINDDLGGNNEDTSDDIPRPDPDPLDDDGGHGSHTSGTVAGIGVPGEIGPGAAPKAKLYAIKVWDEGNSSADVLVAGFERAVDPNDDGDTSDAPDVLSFSGGVDYGTESSVEARAAQRVVNLGVTFVASAGNAGNQPVGGSAYIVGTPATAPGVIAVAASIDEFNATALTVDTPATELPDGGLMVNQEWSEPLTSDLTDSVIDAREFDVPADPADPAASDRMLCDPIPGTPFGGHIALIYKASSTAGDCFADDKVANAQAAGAGAVILWNGFGGLPSQIGIGGDGSNINVPVVMISTGDSEVLGDVISPDAAASSFNTVATTVTLGSDETLFPEFTDAMTDFTSEGPARVSSALKPDITAPGFDIQSTDNGTGDQGVKFSGTSMSAPLVSGVATLIRQIHPGWPPERIKAVLMNQATQELADNGLNSPVSATVAGAGRVQADESANAVSVATPGSLSFQISHHGSSTSSSQRITVRNTDSKSHHYKASGGGPRYSDFDPAVAHADVSTGGAFSHSASFDLAPGAKKSVTVRLTVDPSVLSEADEENGWYYFLGNADGNVVISQSHQGKDTLHVPWHVVPLASPDSSLSENSLDLTGGPDQMTLSSPGLGTPYADLYMLGDVDGDNSKGEEDVVATGARSFTGADAEDGDAVGVPAGVDEAGGIGWQDFLTNDDTPAEPIEFGVQTYGVHNVTETLEVDVLVDAGADGVYAGDPIDIPADYLVIKMAAPDSTSGEVCVLDLSLPDPFDECTATYFADYSNYNSNLVGLVVDASEIGVDNADHKLAYAVTACTGSFSGDQPGFLCDDAGEEDGGVYTAQLDATNPALEIDKLVCAGFWHGPACAGGDPIEVSNGSAAPGDDPAILGLFPNNAPSHDPVVIHTEN